jgi:hypothetical protein
MRSKLLDLRSKLRALRRVDMRSKLLALSKAFSLRGRRRQMRRVFQQRAV